ncbi:MAG: hypothetical protein AB1777_12765 [Bacteroidota bacterium]
MKRIWKMELSQKEIKMGKRILASILLPIFVFYATSLNFLALSLMSAGAANGSGTMTVDDDSVIAGAVGQVFKFTFNPSEDMDGGAVKITVPNSWSVPVEGDGVLDVDGEILVEGKNGADLDADDDGNADVSINGREIAVNIQTMSASQYFTLKYNVATIPTLAGSYEFITESKLAGGSYKKLSDARQASIDVEAGPVASYQISAIADQVVGVNFNVTITAKDAYNNTTTGSDPVSINVKAGTGQFNGRYDS